MESKQYNLKPYFPQAPFPQISSYFPPQGCHPNWRNIARESKQSYPWYNLFSRRQFHVFLIQEEAVSCILKRCKAPHNGRLFIAAWLLNNGKFCRAQEHPHNGWFCRDSGLSQNRRYCRATGVPHNLKLCTGEGNNRRLYIATGFYRIEDSA